MPKAAKVTHPLRRLLNCECDPPLKPLLPPRAKSPYPPYTLDTWYRCTAFYKKRPERTNAPRGPTSLGALARDAD
eukprot:3254427-Prymnesium_polylepis.1